MAKDRRQTSVILRMPQLRSETWGMSSYAAWQAARVTPDPQYDNATTYAQCVGHTPHTSYAVPQFWYNAFKWSVPSAACFTIDQPADPVQQIVY